MTEAFALLWTAYKVDRHFQKAYLSAGVSQGLNQPRPIMLENRWSYPK